VCIGEPHALRGKSIEVRRWDFRGRVVAAGIAIAKVVGQDEDEVGPDKVSLGGSRAIWGRMRKQYTAPEKDKCSMQGRAVHGKGVSFLSACPFPSCSLQ
jgi:hypothetical protein